MKAKRKRDSSMPDVTWIKLAVQTHMFLFFFRGLWSPCTAIVQQQPGSAGTEPLHLAACPLEN